MIHKRSTALEWSVKYFAGGLKPISRFQICSEKNVRKQIIHQRTDGVECTSFLGQTS